MLLNVVHIMAQGGVKRQSPKTAIVRSRREKGKEGACTYVLYRTHRRYNIVNPLLSSLLQMTVEAGTPIAYLVPSNVNSPLYWVFTYKV